MTPKKDLKELSMILVATIVLTITVAFVNHSITLAVFASFLIIICLNILVKKIIGYFLETDVKTKFWSMYQFGFRKDAHFKKPLPMIWLPIILTVFTRGFFWWLGILEFDVEAKTERVSRRHGLYRFTEVTEWHMGVIATFGIVATLIAAIIGYFLGFELFTKLSIYYAFWSIIPLSSLDGSKIFFASKYLWAIIAAVTSLFLLIGLGL